MVYWKRRCERIHWSVFAWSGYGHDDPVRYTGKWFVSFKHSAIHYSFCISITLLSDNDSARVNKYHFAIDCRLFSDGNTYFHLRSSGRPACSSRRIRFPHRDQPAHWWTWCESKLSLAEQGTLGYKANKDMGLQQYGPWHRRAQLCISGSLDTSRAKKQHTLQLLVISYGIREAVSHAVTYFHAYGFETKKSAGSAEFRYSYETVIK